MNDRNSTLSGFKELDPTLSGTFKNESSIFSEIKEANSTLLSNIQENFNSTLISEVREEQNSTLFSKVKEASSITVSKAAEVDSRVSAKFAEFNSTVSNKTIEFNSTLQPALDRLPLTVLTVRCGLNQELKECGSACPPTCNVQNSPCEEHCIKDVCQCKVSLINFQ